MKHLPKCVMLGGKKEVVTSGEMPMETVALATKNNPSIDKSSGDQRNKQRGGRLWCSHCDKPGHTRDTCWDIHYKPSNWKSRGSNKGKGFQATVEENNEDTRANSDMIEIYFTKAQLEQLQKLLSQPTTPSKILKFTSPMSKPQKTYPTFRSVSSILLRTFECTAFEYVRPQHRSKLDPKSNKCVFIGNQPLNGDKPESLQGQESEPILSPDEQADDHTHHDGTDHSIQKGAENLTEDVYLDLPIALRKGTRTYGSVNRHKVKLVAKGFTQTYGVDYQETFAPVAKLNTVRVLLSLASNIDWPLQQLDVKNAFLYGDLHEEVYMDCPPGFEREGNLACRFKKSLYGSKHSPIEWFKKFTQAVKRRGFKQAQTYHTLFYKHSKEGKIAILIVYVDDIIITGDDRGELDTLKLYLAGEFELKDLGALRYFLGMEVARSKSGITVSQRKYVPDLLRDTVMLGCRPAETLMEPNAKLDIEGGKDVDREQYRRLVGKLIYFSHTRPDIAFAVSVINQFMHSPKKKHLDAVYRVLRYELWKPYLRAMMECDMKAVSIGTKRKTEVLATCLQQMKACFLDARLKKVKLFEAMSVFFDRSNRSGGYEQPTVGDVVRLCGLCQEADMVLRKKPDYGDEDYDVGVVQIQHLEEVDLLGLDLILDPLLLLTSKIDKKFSTSFKDSVGITNEMLGNRNCFFMKYFPTNVKEAMESNFTRIAQHPNETITEYKERFARLSRFVLHVVQDESHRARKFREGLRFEMRRQISIMDNPTYAQVVDGAQRL
ncbi:hypothetical protein RJ640_022680 [Escallonia rubra]|uniref:Reverse transcriptase Ty1/copia-type domain-containing protein n=1 Tax=Escallonia rubra TaxID=112253 RepID=A0AA88R4C8_9ASTE|nr:hypothetical protein RJ640_022680 [Escallonia rubra]